MNNFIIHIVHIVCVPLRVLQQTENKQRDADNIADRLSMLINQIYRWFSLLLFKFCYKFTVHTHNNKSFEDVLSNFWGPHYSIYRWMGTNTHILFDEISFESNHYTWTFDWRNCLLLASYTTIHKCKIAKATCVIKPLWTKRKETKCFESNEFSSSICYSPDKMMLDMLNISKWKQRLRERIKKKKKK